MRSVEKGPLVVFKGQFSNEKRSPGCLRYIGDETMPCFVGKIS